MKFKDYNDYLTQRNALLDQAEQLLQDGNLEEFENVKNSVDDLDKEWSEFSNHKANLEALKGNKGVNPFPIDGRTKTGSVENEADTYRRAFGNYLLGRGLDNNERTVFEKFNPDFSNATQTTTSVQVVIPETMRSGIWTEIGEMHPIFGDSSPTYVPGDLTIIKENTSGDDGEWYDEGTSVAESDVDLGEIRLSGCELAKCITVSWKLKKMSIDAFLAYITTKIAEKMGNALAKSEYNGQGKPSTDDNFKEQPTGVKTKLLAETSTPQVKTYTASAGISYDDVVDTFAKVKSGYKKIAYANGTTIWSHLAKIKDANKRPIFIPDTTAGGIGYLFGVLVKEEDAISDGELLVGDYAKGYVMNINENMTIYQEDHVKPRTTDYVGYALVDGDVLTTKAFALLMPGASA